MKQRTIISVTTIMLVGSFVFGAAECGSAGNTEKQPAKIAAAPAKIEWLSYEAGITKAKKEGKHVLIDFYTSWCGWCKKMDRTTFADKAVIAAMSETMVAVKVNAESKEPVKYEDKSITKRELSGRVFGVRGYPTYWFLQPDGEKLFRVPGYKQTSDFLNLIEYVGDKHYKKLSYSTFLESKKNDKKPSKKQP